MRKRHQGDIIPVWTITIFEGSIPLFSKSFKGNYEAAIEKAQYVLDEYKKLDDVFKVTHYEVN